VEPPAGAERAAADQVRRAVGEAFIDGYRAVMLACAALALLGAGSAAVLIRPARS
jgi:hypothetical protein